MSDEAFELYVPGNGTEGSWFEARWCNRCVRDQSYDEETGANGCDILADALCNLEPVQWRQDGPEGPRCTAFEDVGR